MKDIKEIFNLITVESIMMDILVIILGVFLMTSPAVGEEAALLLIGILLLISGVCSIIKYILNPKRLFKIELGFGIISVIAGLFAIFKPFQVAMLITVLTAIWLIISSVIKLIMALELRKIKEETWIFDLTVFILIIIIGILILVNPFKSNMILTVFIGVMMSIYAAMDIVEQFFMRKRINKIINIFSK